MVQELKSDFHKRINAQLLEIEEKIEQIDLQLRQSGREVEQAFPEELERLRSTPDEAESKLNALSRSSEGVWQKLRFDLEELVCDLNQAVDEALKTAQAL